MDVLKLIDLQDKGYTAAEVSAQLGENDRKVRKVARDIGCPFPLHPKKNYRCVDCLTPESATFNIRTCKKCRDKQAEHGIKHIETYEVPGVGL